jgi:tetratricopeptide (TPR) repeat protein
VEDVEAPLGAVTLEMSRAFERKPLPLDSGEFGLQVRPWLSAAALAHYERGRPAPRQERARAYRQAADEAHRRNETAAAFWLLLETARLGAETGDREAALRALDEAQALAGDDRVLGIQMQEGRSRAVQALGSPRQAEEFLQQALRLRQAREPDGLSAAAGLEALGALAWSQSDPPGAERHHSHALRIREERAPGTIVHARSLRQVANIHWGRGDLAQAETLVARALGVATAREPDGRTVANTINTRGNIAQSRGRYREAVEDYRRVVELREKVEPWSTEVCFALNNIGLVALERGELETAEEMFERSYRCLREARPGGPWTVHWLNMRGLIATERGEFAAARQSFLQALPSAEKQGAAPRRSSCTAWASWPWKRATWLAPAPTSSALSPSARRTTAAKAPGMRMRWGCWATSRCARATWPRRGRSSIGPSPSRTSLRPTGWERPASCSSWRAPRRRPAIRGEPSSSTRKRWVPFACSPLAPTWRRNR